MNSVPIVYVVQDPAGKEILPASRFGKLQVILTGKEKTSLAVDKLAETLKNFKPDDYLLPIGSPVNVGVATHIAMLVNGGDIKMLLWDRENYAYNVEHITLHDDTDQPVNTTARH